MTKNNEQITIDDLDTRCPYHCSDKVGQCNNPSQETPHTYCIDNKDCIYKLKAENNTLFKAIEEVNKINKRLESENEKLIKTLSEEQIRRREYEMTLEEIREICNKTLCDYLQCSLNYNHSKDFECEKTSCNRAKRRKFILEILQKINESDIK